MSRKNNKHRRPITEKKSRSAKDNQRRSVYDQTHVGVFLSNGKRGFFAPCHRKDPFPGMPCPPDVAKNLQEGDVVVYGVDHPDTVVIHQHLGNLKDAHIFSLMTIQEREIPVTFSKEALDIADKGRVPPLKGRTDLRDIPFVTIDGEDAKDFDDAVWAAPDTSPDNLGGWLVAVAIADVSYYVRPHDALDQEAFNRGNSVYFPDRVVPMLPEALSNGLCSLKPNEDRACLAVEMIISKDGDIRSYAFKRGLMHSVARLTYKQVQRAMDGHPDSITKPLLEPIIQPLYGAYSSFLKARNKRGTLNLDIPEQKVKFNEEGRVVSIDPMEIFDSHQLIEEMMIAANVCAAKTLLKRNMPGLFRVHDIPDTVRVSNLKTLLSSLKIGGVSKQKKMSAHEFNNILDKTRHGSYERLVHDLVLRSQAQALYTFKNIGHFGLSLQAYTHFTSPIRRYSDLIVHRALISTLQLGHDGFAYGTEELQKISDHINMTERRAVGAERDTMDRYVISYLQGHVGDFFHATIVGVTKSGIFVALDGNGAQGLLRKHQLPGDYYEFDEPYHRYIGVRTKRTYQLGQRVRVLVEDINVVNGTTHFSLARDETKKHNHPHKEVFLLDRKKPKKTKKPKKS